MWKDQNWQAAAGAPVLGFACALIAWLVTAKRECGVLNVDCTGSNNPMLAGNVTALLSPIIFIPILTFAFGRQNYNWESMRQIRKGDDTEIIRRASVDSEIQREVLARTAEQEAAEQKKLNKAAIISRSLTVFMTLALLVLWPMPLYGTGYIFSKSFFTGKLTATLAFSQNPFGTNTCPSTGWVVVGILWLFCSTFAVGLFPLWQGRKTMGHTLKSMFLDMTGKRHPAIHGRVAEVEEASGEQTPEEKVVVKGE
jgi:urea-proton symporter